MDEEMDKEVATQFFADFFGGKHHIPAEIREWGLGWCLNTFQELSTFDYNSLTRLVFMAHDRCIRVAILPSGPGRVKIVIWQRERQGGVTERHPTIEDALRTWREKHPESEVKA